MAVKDRDKYTILTEEMRTALSLQIAHREESDAEDLFSARRGSSV
jgi:hypothetical protein